MAAPIGMLIMGAVSCAAGILIIMFRRRLTNWQNYMNREFGWNPRGAQRFVSVSGMTVIGSGGLVIGAVLIVNGLFRLWSLSNSLS